MEYNISQAARAADVDRTTIFIAIASRQLEATCEGKGKGMRWRIRADDLARWVAERKAPQGAAE